jgi:hypothetical protein
MSSRRIARRVASRSRCQNTSPGADVVKTLVTKDMHCPVQSFSVGGPGRRLAIAARWWLVAWLMGHGQRRAGVRLFFQYGGARRVVWRVVPVLTPCLSPSLVTKEKRVKGMA